MFLIRSKYSGWKRIEQDDYDDAVHEYLKWLYWDQEKISIHDSEDRELRFRIQVYDCHTITLYSDHGTVSLDFGTDYRDYWPVNPEIRKSIDEFLKDEK